MKIALSRARSALSCSLTTSTEGRSVHTAKNLLVVNKQLLRAMKLTGFLILAACLHVTASGTGQSITLSLRDTPLRKVFKEIIRQSGITIVYDDISLKDAKPVTIEVKDASVEQVLDICLKGQPFSYTREEGYLYVKPTPSTQGLNPGLQEPHFSAATSPPVTGIVRDVEGNPIAGVNIVVKGTNRGVVSDANGLFSINAEEGETLIISYVGYSSRQIKATSSVGIIILEKSQSKLDEVQVVAYGTNTQRYQVGSVAKITSEEIEKQPVYNPLGALQGRVPGLVVSNTSGIPGGGYKIQIRGQNTLNPTTDNNVMPFDNPLIIIDGIPFAPNNDKINQLVSLASPGQSNAWGNQYGGISPLNSISPSDISSIEVLKDADATSIYGSRAANGVILITTKKGQPGKLKASASVYHGVSHVGRTIEMMSLQERLQFRRHAFAQDSIEPDISTAPDLLVFDTTKNTDWKEYFLGKSATTTDVNSQITGGNATTNFRFAGNYHRETFILPGDFDDARTGLNFNLHHATLNQKFLFDVGVTYSYNQTNSGASADALRAFAYTPNYPDMLDQEGNLVWEYKGLELGNPLQYLKRKYDGKGYNLLTNLSVKYEILPGLNLSSNQGYNSNNFEEISMTPTIAQHPDYAASGGFADFGNKAIRSWTIEPKLDYTKSFGNGKLNVLAGTTFQKSTRASTIISGSGYTNDLLIGSLAGAGTITKGGISNNVSKFSSVYGRINYIHAAKYILNITARRDASSKFGPGKQIGNFGSAGLGWIFSEENFVKNTVRFLSYGKIR
ncbi:MAG: SusC/RagA family TonB-linked outer membrane protein, partial [Chitinophagaceae bacterium]|nr:SusC/RagA family TonB-linked outer membrane protein [Chitinophagaceae bacterium]